MTDAERHHSTDSCPVCDSSSILAEIKPAFVAGTGGPGLGVLLAHIFKLLQTMKRHKLEHLLGHFTTFDGDKLLFLLQWQEECFYCPLVFWV